MRALFVTMLLAGLTSSVSLSFGQDKKEASSDELKCLIVRAADKDVTPPVDVDYASKFKAKSKLAISAATAKSLCKSESNKAASEWIRDHGACDGTKMTWKYTVAFGKPGQDEKLEQNVVCAKK
jgi:hypothetical protein